MDKRALNLLLLFSIVAMLTGCKKPASIAGRLEGVWETEWEKNIGKNDVEDLHVTEVIQFTSPENKKSSKSGEFIQIFTGDVDFDDWEYEENIKFRVTVSGKWQLSGPDELVLNYDFSSLNVETGESNVKGTDNIDLAIDFLTGNYGSMFANALYGAAEEKKANAKITESVNKEVTRFFKEYLRKLKSKKPAMKDIVIADDEMKCKMNTGFFGKEVIYDYKGEAYTPQSISANTAYNGSVIIPAETAPGMIFDNPFTWMSERKITHSDISGLSASDLRILRNAIYAMHGHKFKSKDLQRYFASFTWYTPMGDASYELSKLEQQNVAFIKSYE